MSYYQEHAARMARLHEQSRAIQQDWRADEKIRNEKDRRERWERYAAAQRQPQIDQDRARDQLRAAFRSVFGSSEHIDRESGR